MSVQIVDQNQEVLDLQPKTIESQFQSILEGRTQAITTKIFKAMKEMGIPRETRSKVFVRINIENPSSDPYVQKVGNQILFEIPLLFLLEENDFIPGSVFYKVLEKRGFDQEIIDNLTSFREFTKNQDLAEKAKDFILYHEIAHILHEHIFSNASDQSNSKIKEREADLTAALFCEGAVEGGTYLFSVVPESLYEESETHPSNAERISYLQNFDRTKLVATPIIDCDDLDDFIEEGEVLV